MSESQEASDTPASSERTAEGGREVSENPNPVAGNLNRTNDGNGRGVSERPKSNQSLHRRRPSRSDLVTGKIREEQQQRGVVACELTTRDAMGTLARRRARLKKAMSPFMTKLKRRHDDVEIDDNISTSVRGRLTVQATRLHGDIEEGDEESASEASKHIQYRLTARRKAREGRVFRILQFIGLRVGADVIYDEDGSDQNSGIQCCGISPNHSVTRFVNYLFRTSFLNVLFNAAIGFYVLTLSFALLIFAAGVNHPDCISVNGQWFGESGDGKRFGDAFALSWTTFSTAGYGAIFPSTSGTTESDYYKRCAAIQMLCSFEAFVGLLFGSFCGAIVFGKVVRARSFAHVIFSDPLVVRYGKGAREEIDVDSSSDEEEDESSLPCPVLEFRVINGMHSTPGGELMDASLNIVCSIDESQAGTMAGMVTRGRRRRKGKRRRRPSVIARDKIPLTLPEKTSLFAGHPGDIEPAPHPFAKSSRAIQAVDEDLDAEVESRRVFMKLELETADHPFFKRVWTARHVLTADSPLLRPQVRKQVAENNGFWPAELNNHAATRASIRFDQILVSLSGTSNSGANTVYAQKIYDYVDMNVGYRFANVLYRNLDGSLGVDTTFVHDVLEQAGGGGEPLSADD